jgi:hypothetical protein
LEFRGTTTDREEFVNPSRTDWILRLRRPFENGWHADLTAGQATVQLDTLAQASDTIPKLEATARQMALRGAKTADNWQAYVSARWWDGPDVPPFETEAAFELDAGPASFYVAGHYAYWQEFNTGGVYASLYFDLPLGLRFLGEGEIGDRGLFGQSGVGLLDAPGATPRIRMAYDRGALGLELKVWSWRIGVRGGEVRTEPSLGLGAPVDSTVSVAGGRVNTGEAWASGPLFKLFGGTAVIGGRYWRRDSGPFLYWPVEQWRVEGMYRVLALADQLEVLLTGLGGVRGSMFVIDQEFTPATVVATGDLNWWRVEAVVRIKDFHLWYNYEFYDSSGIRGEIPGRDLPRGRYHFGVKWVFWN